MGYKNNKDIFSNLLEKLIPNNIKLYIEPFGGEFGLYEIMKNKPIISIYNDINYDLYKLIKNRYNNILCFNKDYKEIIYEYDNFDTFFYLDPPYLDKYFYYKNHNFINIENHIELSNILKNIKGKFLLSYQDKPLIRELYKDYNFYKYNGKNKFRLSEIAITNYKLQ